MAFWYDPFRRPVSRPLSVHVRRRVHRSCTSVPSFIGFLSKIASMRSSYTENHHHHQRDELGSPSQPIRAVEEPRQIIPTSTPAKQRCGTSKPAASASFGDISLQDIVGRYPGIRTSTPNT
ncbi:TonB-denpendent receptor [Anopheles sinensis]|uniref:TonB-denpendent receptor n=1 Tax=Anopheles sinensis TaxID=74873 RepID=A0A084WNT6_ANOSI|nr:TonB-denpendent receptor [Anopheles sinensis]